MVAQEIMKKFFSTPLLLVLFFGATMFGMSFRTPMWMDEYVFYRLALAFPESYSMNADIFFVDRPAMLSPNIDWASRGLDRETMFRMVYDTPVYPHTPLTVIAVSPLVKGLNFLADREVIPHIEEELGYPPGAAKDTVKFQSMRAEFITNILRTISIFFSMATMYLVYKLLEKKVGKNALLFAVPIAGSIMMLYGAYLFYWDVFMMFFFTLTLYFMEVKPESKWKYVTACCLVNTKMFLGIAFLFPLFVKQFIVDYKKSGWIWPIPGWKMALPILSLFPFYIYSLTIVGDPLYFWHHYSAQVPLHDFIYTLNTTFDYVMIFVNLGMPFYLLLTTPIILFIRKYPSYVIFWAMSMFYAWATGLGITHTSTMVYSGALVFPLVAHEYNLIGRVKSFAYRVKCKSFRLYLAHKGKNV